MLYKHKNYSPTVYPAIMMLYKHTNVNVCSSVGDTDYFDIVAGVHIFIICLDYVLPMSIELMKYNGFKLAKERNRRYSSQQVQMQTTPMI